MNKKLKVILILSIFVILNLLFSITVKSLASTMHTSAGTVNVGTGDRVTLRAADYTDNANVFCNDPSGDFIRI